MFNGFVEEIVRTIRGQPQQSLGNEGDFPPQLPPNAENEGPPVAYNWYGTYNSVINKLKKVMILLHNKMFLLTNWVTTTAQEFIRFIPDWMPIGEDISPYR